MCDFASGGVGTCQPIAARGRRSRPVGQHLMQLAHERRALLLKHRAQLEQTLHLLAAFDVFAGATFRRRRRRRLAIKCREDGEQITGNVTLLLLLLLR